jgi:conjugal transfer pilus assembly protein TrbC
MRVKMFTLLRFVALAALTLSVANAESMQNDILAQWRTYVVVSSTLPRDQLVSLAHEASLANAVMVLNGFPNKNNSIPDTQRFISEVNSICCDKRPSRWIIDPKISERYHVTAAPSFVIARGESGRNEDFSVISGDLDLANALKFFAQRSGSSAVRQHATVVYQRAFAEH